MNNRKVSNSSTQSPTHSQGTGEKSRRGYRDDNRYLHSVPQFWHPEYQRNHATGHWLWLAGIVGGFVELPFGNIHLYGFSLASSVLAFASLFFILPAIPHSIEPLVIIDLYRLFFLGIILLSTFLVTLLSSEYIRQLEGVREEYYIILFASTLGAFGVISLLSTVQYEAQLINPSKTYFPEGTPH